MTSQQFLDLSTRLVKDLKEWSQEATHRTTVPPEQLTALERAADIVERITVEAVATGLDTTG